MGRYRVQHPIGQRVKYLHKRFILNRRVIDHEERTTYLLLFCVHVHSLDLLCSSEAALTTIVKLCHAVMTFLRYLTEIIPLLQRNIFSLFRRSLYKVSHVSHNVECYLLFVVIIRNVITISVLYYMKLNNI